MGMIFVPSVDGISHSPRELTHWEDCANGANMLLHTVFEWTAAASGTAYSPGVGPVWGSPHSSSACVTFSFRVPRLLLRLLNITFEQHDFANRRDRLGRFLKRYLLTDGSPLGLAASDVSDISSRMNNSYAVLKG